MSGYVQGTNGNSPQIDFNMGYQISRYHHTLSDINNLSRMISEINSNLVEAIETLKKFQTESSLYTAESEEELMKQISNMDMLKCIKDEFNVTTIKNFIEHHFLIFDKVIEYLNQTIPLYNSTKQYYASLSLNENFKMNSENEQPVEQSELNDTKLESDLINSDNTDLYGFEQLANRK